VGILLWAVFGLIAGAIAMFLMPGRVPGGTLVTIALGIVGAVVRGFIGAQLGFGNISGFDLRSMLLAVGGGALVLFIYGLVTRARAWRQGGASMIW
jgi:uncharacterized membrane protein YeaQ/YmgE (transglycosylase-associated protein family)